MLKNKNKPTENRHFSEIAKKGLLIYKRIKTNINEPVT